MASRRYRSPELGKQSMFAIYDSESRQVRDTLENLRKVRETQAGLAMQLHMNLSEVLA